MAKCFTPASFKECASSPFTLRKWSLLLVRKRKGWEVQVTGFYLMAGDEQSCPYKETWDSLSSSGHEEYWLLHSRGAAILWHPGEVRSHSWSGGSWPQSGGCSDISHHNHGAFWCEVPVGIAKELPTGQDLSGKRTTKQLNTAERSQECNRTLHLSRAFHQAARMLCEQDLGKSDTATPRDVTDHVVLKNLWQPPRDHEIWPLPSSPSFCNKNI